MKFRKYLQESPFFLLPRCLDLIQLELKKSLRNRDIAPLQALVLLALYFDREKISQPKELAQEFSVSKSRMSQIIHALELKHFIEREWPKEDKRKHCIKITLKGIKEAKVLIQIFESSERLLQTQLGDRWQNMANLSQSILKDLREPDHL